MTGDPPDPWEPAEQTVTRPVDVLEGGLAPPWWQRRWSALPPAGRRLVIAVVVLLAVGAGSLWLRDRAADRALAQRVDVTASVAVSSSSTTPVGGQVSFFIVVRNEGPLPVRLTSVEGSVDGLRLRDLDDLAPPVAPGKQAAVPVSVRLTCARYSGGDGLDVAITVRREDGGSATRRVRAGSAHLLLDVATTLCSVRPGLRDRELSGPVLVTAGQRSAGLWHVAGSGGGRSEPGVR